MAAAISHNHNCAQYLQHLDFNMETFQALAAENPANRFLQDIIRFFTTVRPEAEMDFTAQYAAFLDLMESPEAVKFFKEILDGFDQSQKEGNKPPAGYQAVARLLKSVYDNDNKVMDNFSAFIEGALQDMPAGSDPKEVLKAAYARETAEEGRGKFSDPSREERTLAEYVGSYHPQRLTSIPTLFSDLPYQEEKRKRGESLPTQYRLGMQAKHTGRKASVNPLFLLWLRVKRQENPHHRHLYINLMPRVTPRYFQFDLIGTRQKEWADTMAKEFLGGEHPNIIFVTLPTNEEWMKREYSGPEGHKQSMKVSDAETELRRILDSFTDIAKYLTPPKLRDFLKQSFLKVLGPEEYRDHQVITYAKIQAVWMHFNNYALPKALITELKVDGFNMTCKSGINRGDRGAALYHLFSSFEEGNIPLTQAEFNEIIHAAALMVKGCGMKSDRFVGLWNLIDVYVNAHTDELKADPRKAWLIGWRNENCPPEHLSRLKLANDKEATPATLISTTPFFGVGVDHCITPSSDATSEVERGDEMSGRRLEQKEFTHEQGF